MQKIITTQGKRMIHVEMSPSQHKKYLAFLEAEKVADSIKKGFYELQNAKAGKTTLKSAYDLANEL